VNEFVEECRREWKRLGVPDPVANEMAADLTVDLEEAEADGASAEEVLGRGAHDPRSFATAWATERGLVQRPRLPGGRGLLRRSHPAAAIGAVFALIAIVGAALVISASSSGSRRLGLPPRPEFRAAPGAVWVAAPGAIPRVMVIAEGTNDSGVDTHTVGSVLLIVGLAGSVPFMLVWLWVGPSGWSRRRTHIDDRSSRPGY
jgi:hypothetical protein